MVLLNQTNILISEAIVPGEPGAEYGVNDRDSLLGMQERRSINVHMTQVGQGRMLTVALVPAPPIQNLLAAFLGVLRMKVCDAASYIACTTTTSD